MTYLSGYWEIQKDNQSMEDLAVSGTWVHRGTHYAYFDSPVRKVIAWQLAKSFLQTALTLPV